MTHFAIAEPWRRDRVEIEEDAYRDLLAVAQQPIAEVLETFVSLVEYDFFDAHHEPQHAFFVDRKMALRTNPRLYLTESFETAVKQIEARCGITTRPAVARGNKGGAKPQTGRTPVIDLARKLTSTGVYREVANSGFLGQRYRGHSGPMRLRELNGLANRFTKELKEAGIDQQLRGRLLALYDLDLRLWELVTKRGGDVEASEVWPLVL